MNATQNIMCCVTKHDPKDLASKDPHTHTLTPLYHAYSDFLHTLSLHSKCQAHVLIWTLPRRESFGFFGFDILTFVFCLSSGHSTCTSLTFIKKTLLYVLDLFIWYSIKLLLFPTLWQFYYHVMKEFDKKKYIYITIEYCGGK